MAVERIKRVRMLEISRGSECLNVSSILTLLIAALLVGCSAASGDDRVVPSISVELTRRPQAVEVRGLDRATLRRLGQLKPDDSAWPRRVAVYVEGGTFDSAPTPPVIGRYSVSGNRVRFEPRFPFAEGVAYRVVVDTTGPRGNASGARLTHRFALPSVARARTTRVTGVYPSATRLPSNL